MILSPVFAGARGGVGDGPVVPPQDSRLLLENGTDKLLLEDGSSFLLLES